MRLTLPGKVVLLVLGLAGLYALWRVAPHGRMWRVPGLRVQFDRPGPTGTTTEVEPHEGIRIGYVGTPPPAAVDLASAGVVPHPAFARETAQDVTLSERGKVAYLLRDVASGNLDAAVVDFPSVVFAARRGNPGFHVVLLTSWRTGADVLAVRDEGAWDPTMPARFEPGTSGEYLLRRVLASGRFSPADVAEGRAWLNAQARGQVPRNVVAAAGRRETMTASERRWTAWTSTADLPVRMPDVLVVNTEWGRREPNTLSALVRAWLQGQNEIPERAGDWRRFVQRQAKALGVDPGSLEPQLRPAPLNDQLAFAGLRDKGTSYTELVMQQMRTLEPGPRPPQIGFTVPMDPVPLNQAAPVLVE